MVRKNTQYANENWEYPIQRRKFLGVCYSSWYRFSMPNHGWICRDESFRVYL